MTTFYNLATTFQNLFLAEIAAVRAEEQLEASNIPAPLSESGSACGKPSGFGYGMGWGIDSKDVWERPGICWTEEPSISGVDDGYLEAKSVKVEAFSSGDINKLYHVTTHDDRTYFFRVHIPVDPFYKTASEVATIGYLGRHTSIPVPEVVAYDASADNELRFEWMILTQIPGVSLDKWWDPCAFEAAKVPQMPFESKKTLVKQLACYINELRSHKFKAIGNLYKRSDLNEADLLVSVPTSDPDFVLGPIASRCCARINPTRARVKCDRGPFKEEAGFARSMCELSLGEYNLADELQCATENEPDSASPEKHQDSEAVPTTKCEPSHRQTLFDRLMALIPTIFPRRATSSPSYKLYHYDLAARNIIINPTTFQITGIIDWEFLPIFPDSFHWEPELIQRNNPTFPDLPIGSNHWECIMDYHGRTTSDYECWLRNWELRELEVLRSIFFETADFAADKKGKELKKYMFYDNLSSTLGGRDGWLLHTERRYTQESFQLGCRDNCCCTASYEIRNLKLGGGTIEESDSDSDSDS
ncbi:hypothetical protein BJ508DRAFT_330249 [Ascobolus immersus RN42]|uniref:Aminoglycoside phosphotransferase domain-containing protein n=1 Tax=Ascobolus immersus RN42 TaxID=1160509 RepID=A0A3N4HU51_ASCIM|nr:hypothetical protein BJ508DRAFT_330249 [Ascobolus immersus RN42]